jgi:hypothetical protein
MGGPSYRAASVHESAIYAALPVISNALAGDLDHELALRWVQHLLRAALKRSDESDA